MTYSEKVIELIQAGNIDEVDVNISLAIDHDDDETLYLLGNTLLQLGFLQETKRVFNHLLDIHPNDDELKIYLAEIEIEDGNELEALDLLHSIDKTSQSYPQSLLVQADYYHLNGLPEVSVQKLKEAESFVPEEPIVQFALAEVYFTIADFKHAIEYYEKLLEANIEEVAGTLISARLGNANLMTGNYQEAANYFSEALSFKDDPEIFYQLGFVYLQQEEYVQVIDSLMQAKTLDPSLLAVYLLLAEAYEKLNQLEKALEAAEEGIAINEMNAELFLIAAELAVKLKNFDLADKYYRDAVALEPENESTILKYAFYLNYIESFDEVIELFDQLPPAMQQDPDAMWLLANANNGIEEYDKARDLFNQAYHYLNDRLDFLKDFAFFLREDGQRKKLREVLEQYMSLASEPDDDILSLLDDFSY